MILASTVSPAGTPIRAVIGRGTEVKPHEVHLVTASTGILIGGSSASCVFPVGSTIVHFENVLLTDEIWVTGTGDLKIIEGGLDKTPSL